MKYEVIHVPRPYILDMMQRIGEICGKFQFISLSRQIAACKDLMAEGGPIDVAVLGGAGCGKSSFINSLIGRPVLPVGVVPVTSAITRLQYGSREQATVTRFDGTYQAIATNDLATFTSDSVNKSNRLNIETVDVELPDLEDYENIRFIDTPNIGSVFQYHGYTSDTWLSHVGAALVVIGADQTLSGHDFEMIRELIQYTPHVAILLTKADLLSTDQRNETLELLERVLERELNRSFPIYPYSTYQNVEKWKHRLEAEVLHRLSVNRNILLKNILQHRCRSLVQSCLNYMDTDIAISEMNLREQNAVREQIFHLGGLYEHTRANLTAVAKENINFVHKAVWEYLRGLSKSMENRLSAELSAAMPTWRGNLWRLSRQYEAWFTDMMSEELQRISRTERRRLFGILRKTHSGYSDVLGEFRSSMVSKIKATLNFQPTETELAFDFIEPDPPHPEISSASDYPVKYLSFLIPMILFRKLVENQFREQISPAVKQNLSQFSRQWEKLILKSIRTMHRQAVYRIKDEVATLQVLFNMDELQMEELKSATEDLRKRATQLLV
ncbi:MAG: dynamin family protein [Syntrophales bacterium]